jgi:hypothetical protein
MNEQRDANSSTFIEKVDAALRQAIADVIEEHQRSGRPLVVSQDGKVVLLPPQKVIAMRKSRHAAAAPKRKKGK